MINDFAHRAPGKIPQTSPFTPKKKEVPKQKLCWWNFRGPTFQGYVGEILEI